MYAATKYHASPSPKNPPVAALYPSTINAGRLRINAQTTTYSFAGPHSLRFFHIQSSPGVYSNVLIRSDGTKEKIATPVKSSPLTFLCRNKEYEIKSRVRLAAVAAMLDRIQMIAILKSVAPLASSPKP
jgi:hypothetical protein